MNENESPLNVEGSPSKTLLWATTTKPVNLELIYNDGIIRGITASSRVLPNFIIIGEQRCGTTSMYDHLIQHPQIMPTLRKEIHFFDNHYNFGLNMYRAFFPTNEEMQKNLQKNGKSITGEASPNYLSHPLVPKRLKENLSNVKLIAMLRNPVVRAYSQFQMMKKTGHETLSFEEAIEYEKHVIKEGKITWKNQHRIFNDTHHPYLMRGIYVNNLKRWLEIFPRNQILIIKSEDFKSNKTEILNETLEFLNVSSYTIKNTKNKNVSKYHRMNSDTKKMLEDFYKPYNEKLSNLLNIDFDW